mmetsp:Transcript_46496/g.101158  ORF Transcript_46496/g.101158 Transcript_46496/m.101158 type:complete len:209 (-) Transcript_46496:1128-1754(-)
MAEVSASIGPGSAIRIIQNSPFESVRTPSQHASSQAIGRTILTKEGLETVHPANGGPSDRGQILRQGLGRKHCTAVDAGLATKRYFQRPGGGHFRWVVTKAKALSQQHHIEKLTSLTLTVVELCSEVLRIVQSNEAVLQVNWKLPWKCLRLPERHDCIPHITTIHPYLGSVVRPSSCRSSKCMRQHDTCWHVASLCFLNAVIRTTICS